MDQNFESNFDEEYDYSRFPPQDIDKTTFDVDAYLQPTLLNIQSFLRDLKKTTVNGNTCYYLLKEDKNYVIQYTPTQQRKSELLLVHYQVQGKEWKDLALLEFKGTSVNFPLLLKTHGCFLEGANTFQKKKIRFRFEASEEAVVTDYFNIVGKLQFKRIKSDKILHLEAEKMKVLALDPSQNLRSTGGQLMRGFLYLEDKNAQYDKNNFKVIVNGIVAPVHSVERNIQKIKFQHCSHFICFDTPRVEEVLFSNLKVDVYYSNVFLNQFTLNYASEMKDVHVDQFTF
eukprot:gene8072-12533_t